MNTPSTRIPSLFVVFALSLATASFLSAAEAEEDDAQVVVLSLVEGDVRLSPGDGKHPSLEKQWQEAQVGMSIEKGYSLATGDGHAGIEFASGNRVYLAQNSLLLFKQLSVNGHRKVTSVTLVTGTATFSFRRHADELFFVETPTDNIQIAVPEDFFVRVDAYLDGTAITPQGEKGESVVRNYLPYLFIPKGQTVFFRDGEVLKQLGANSAELSGSAGNWNMDRFRDAEAQFPDRAALDRSSFHIGASMRVPLLPSDLGRATLPASGQVGSPFRPSQAPSEWDSWVSARIQERSAATEAALKASGLPSPIPSLVDLYEHGSFFDCEPYGKCWEAPPQSLALDDLPQSPSPGTQAPGPAQANATFQPQTVQWRESWIEPCGPATLRTITRLARTPEELQKLLHKKEAAEGAMSRPAPYWSDCRNGYWIHHRGRFARVLTPQAPSRGPLHCLGKKCKPVHPPRPLWVRVNGKVGFVPAHPNDVKGKPPLNLKHGIFLPPAKPGDPMRRMDVEPSRKVTVLDKAPREFRAESMSQTLRVSAPEIHAHIMQEAARDKSFSVSSHAAPQITYDYKSHHFLMAASAVGRAQFRQVPVGGIDSHGRIGSFADGRSGSYAKAFDHSEVAAAYRVGSYGSSHTYGGSSYSGGGHYSGGSSSGSYSSGGHSSGSSSSGGSSGHSSSGESWGGGSSSSSGGSSSSSSSAGGGGSRGRP